MRHGHVEDTDPDVRRRQLDHMRSMTSAERVGLADQLSLAVIELAIADIRAVSPGSTPGEILHEVRIRRFGRTLADAANGLRSYAT